MKTISETQSILWSNLSFLLEQIIINFEGRKVSDYIVKGNDNYLSSVDPLNPLEYE